MGYLSKKKKDPFHWTFVYINWIKDGPPIENLLPLILGQFFPHI